MQSKGTMLSYLTRLPLLHWRTAETKNSPLSLNAVCVLLQLPDFKQLLA